MQTIGLAVLGALAGALSGLTGIGGGVIIVPALIYLFKFPVREAQGTTLAMLVPPIGLLAAWSYYRRGYVDIRAAAILAICFLIGSVFGSELAAAVRQIALRRIFAVILVVVAIEMFFEHR